MHTFQLIIFLRLLITTAAGNLNNYFINPSSNTGINPVWTIGDEQVVSWKTTLGTFNVSLWQQSLVEQAAISQVNLFTKIHSADQINNFTWVVQTYDHELEYSNLFFLWINANQPDGFTSAFFNITKKANSASATHTATAASTGTISPDTSLSTSSSTTSATASSSNAGLVTTSKIALGVGIGAGVPILAALVALVWIKYRNGKAIAAAAAANNNNFHTGTIAPRTLFPNSPPKEMDGHYYPELPGQTAELEGRK